MTFKPIHHLRSNGRGGEIATVFFSLVVTLFLFHPALVFAPTPQSFFSLSPPSPASLLVNTLHSRVALPVAAASLDPAYGPNPLPTDIVVGAFLRFENALLDPQNMIGIDAAVLEQNEKGGIEGRNVRVELPGPSPERNETKRLENFVSRSSQFDAVICSSVLLAGRLPSIAGALGLPVFGPNTVGETFVQASLPFNGRIINLASSAVSGMKQMLNFATRSRLYVKRIMFVHAPAFGSAPVVAAVHQEAAKLGLPSVVEIAVPPFNAAETIRLALQSIDSMIANADPAVPLDAQLPQGIFLIVDEDAVRELINRLYADPRLSRALAYFTTHLVAPSKWANSSGSSEPYRNLYHSMPFPHFHDTRYTVVQQYRAAMARVFAVYPDTNFRNMSKPYQAGLFDYDSFTGYLAARLALEAMARVRRGSAINRTTITEAVFRTRLFEIGDLEFGPFGDGCIGQQSNALAACWCNTGQRRFFTTRINAAGAPESMENDAVHKESNVAVVDMPASTCGYDTTNILRQQAHVLFPQADSVVTAVGSAGADAAAAHRSVLERVDTRLSVARAENSLRRIEVLPNPQPLPTSLSAVAREFFGTGATLPLSYAPDLSARFSPRAFVADSDHLGLRVGSDAWRRFVAGSTAAANASNVSMAAQLQLLSLGRFRYAWPEEDPPVQPFALWDAAKMEVPVYPVLADLVHTAVAFAQQAGSLAQVHVIADTASMVAVARRSLHTFGARDFASVQVLPAAGTPTLPSGGFVVVASQQPAVLRSVAQQSVATTGVTVVLCASEFVVQTALYGTTSAPSLRYVSGLRSYGSHRNATTAYGDFLADVVTRDLSDTATADLPEYLFSLGRIATTVAAIGPLSALRCPDDAVASGQRSAGSTCQCNKGITAFHVRKLNAWGNATAPEFSFAHAGCGVQYRALPELSSSSGLSNAEVIAIAAGGAAAVALLIVSAAALYVLCFKTRTSASKQLKHAPQDPRIAFTMVFTDIQASTALWAHAPQHMGEALDAHHDLIRAIVADCHGYEVKTIGDSFMVAFKDPLQAVRFSLAVQRELHGYDWGTALFDAAYREQLFEAGVEDDSGPQWAGLRVRVGIHHGTGDIKLDDTTQSYDYYGTVVNTAARVEAVGHGGQVLLSSDALDAAGGAACVGTASHDAVLTDLGPQPLRGLDDPVRLYQLVPAELTDRTFPPLRLDKETHLDATMDGSDAASATPGGPDDAQSECSGTSRQSSNRSRRTGRDDVSENSSTVASRNLDAATHKTARILRLRTSAAGLAFAYRLVDTMLSTTTQKVRAQLVADVAKRWRVPQPLPKWARISASALSIAQGGPSSGKEKDRATEQQDRIAGQMLFTLARVMATLEALPGAARPVWAGTRTTKGGPSAPQGGPSRNPSISEGVHTFQPESLGASVTSGTRTPSIVTDGNRSVTACAVSTSSAQHLPVPGA